jgi:hypothetical protein
MKAAIMINGEDNLCEMRCDALPRKGDFIVLYGKDFGEENKPGEEMFLVEEVLWRYDVDDQLDEGRPEIMVRPVDQGYQRKCTCGPERRKPKEDDTRSCDDCNGRIPPR